MRLVEEQILNERFDPHFNPAIFAGGGFAEGFLAAQMNNIDVGIVHFGEREQMMNALGLHQRRPAFVMPFRSGLALGKQSLLHLQNQVGVFAMCRGNDA